MNKALNRGDVQKLALPLLIALFFTGLFAYLGMWQLERAAYKKSLAESFVRSDSYLRVMGDMTVDTFQPVRARGRYLFDRQVLIDNIVKNGRLGMYVITPFEFAGDQPLLLVNRGWLAKPLAADSITTPDDADLEIFGKSGDLPKVGIRPGEAFEGPSDWPRIAVYPTREEVAAAIGREVLSFVLLLDPDPDSAMLRQWQPVQSGPATHYGYAFQWFAMATTVIVVTVWQLRKRRRHD